MLRISDLASIALIIGFMVPGPLFMPSTSSSLARAGKARAISAAASDVTRRNMVQHRRIRPMARQLPWAYRAAMDQRDAPIGYMERTRLYYRALGYDNDYAWAHFPEVPFTPLGRPLAETRIGLVTTA